MKNFENEVVKEVLEDFKKTKIDDAMKSRYLLQILCMSEKDRKKLIRNKLKKIIQEKGLAV